MTGKEPVVSKDILKLRSALGSLMGTTPRPVDEASLEMTLIGRGMTEKEARSLIEERLEDGELQRVMMLSSVPRSDEIPAKEMLDAKDFLQRAAHLVQEVIDHIGAASYHIGRYISAGVLSLSEDRLERLKGERDALSRLQGEEERTMRDLVGIRDIIRELTRED